MRAFVVGRVADDDRDWRLGLDLVGAALGPGERGVGCGDLSLLDIRVVESVGHVKAHAVGRRGCAVGLQQVGDAHLGDRVGPHLQLETDQRTRRRIERDLHDGAQQRLLSVTLELRAAQAEVPPEYRAALSHAIEELTSAVNELREIARGIYPSILAHGGLGPALKTLAHRSAVPVKLDMQATARLPERVEVAAYYIISEALTNAAKHARASVVQVSVEARDRILCVGVDDDGQGGADLGLGSGLLGLKDRAEAIGGTMSLQSARGEGTSLRVELPLDDQEQYPTR